jgi:voltage-gated potassium channel
MTDDSNEPRRRKRTLRGLEAWLQTPMIVLSFVWLLLVIIELIWGTSGLLSVLGTAIWVAFIAEFALRLRLSPDRWRFIATNWLTVVALLVPAFRLLSVFRFLRFARAARGLRLVKVITTANRGMNALRRSMRRRGFGYVGLLTACVVLLGAAGMQALEPATEVKSGFASYGDALWWTSMLVATMGTDFWPKTTEGRLLCFLIAVYGYAVWGYVTAALATFFIGQEHRPNRSSPSERLEIGALRQDIERLRADLALAQRRMEGIGHEVTPEADQPRVISDV